MRRCFDGEQGVGMFQKGSIGTMNARNVYGM